MRGHVNIEVATQNVKLTLSSEPTQPALKMSRVANKIRLQRWKYSFCQGKNVKELKSNPPTHPKRQYDVLCGNMNIEVTSYKAD